MYDNSFCVNKIQSFYVLQHVFILPAQRYFQCAILVDFKCENLLIEN